MKGIRVIDPLSETSIERKILIGLITSEEFLVRFRPLYRGEEDLLSTSFSQLVAKWCIQYYEDTERCPRKDIRDIFDAEIEEGHLTPEERKLVDRFLVSISKEHASGRESFPVDFVLGKAELLFQQRYGEQFNERLKAAIDLPDQHSSLIASYDPPSLRGVIGENPYALTYEQMEEIYAAREKPLIELPGALGEFMNDQLVREGFIAFQAPEKRGKSWWLIELAYQAVRTGNTVAFFEVGDMGREETHKRFHARLLNRPTVLGWDESGPPPRFINVPLLDCLSGQDGSCSFSFCRASGRLDRTGDESLSPRDLFEDQVQHRPCTECLRKEGYTQHFKGSWWYERMEVKPARIDRTMQAMDQFTTWTGARGLRVFSYPNSSISVTEIDQVLTEMEIYEDYVPDVIIIDYADILKPEGEGDYRHQQNETWKAMRRMSQMRKVLLATATQADSASYGRESQSLRNFSEDKRKYGHVTGMYALNQTEDEKDDGLIRVQALLLRNKSFSSRNQVKVLQGPEIFETVRGSFF